MAILVSGGAGYIGSHTCIELLNAGYDVVVADNYYNASPVVLDRVKQITGKDFRFYNADMTRHEDVEKIFSECPDITAVIQFAAYKAVGESVSKPIEYYYNNLNCTLVILDVMLPGEDGFSILKKLRAAPSLRRLPIIMITAKSSELDTVRGLDCGADDYITKPFGIMEFLSRVRAALRRAEPEARPNVYSFREILLDNARHSVTVSGAPVELTYKEYSLLRLLLENTNLVVTRETILQVVWGTDISVESRTVDMHIRTLRKKLGDAGKYICTVRKVGYKLTDSEEELEQ